MKCSNIHTALLSTATELLLKLLMYQMCSCTTAVVPPYYLSLYGYCGLVTINLPELLLIFQHYLPYMSTLLYAN